MPAVSTNRQVLPPRSISSSTGSRVVPATASTSTRSVPASLLSRLDLPTLGRPISATRRGPPSTASRSAGASGSALSTASSRSPLPRPCSALTAIGSPSPSDHSECTSGSPGASSTLFAASTTGFLDRLRTAATAASASVTPTTASTTNNTASAASTAVRACAATRAASDAVPSSDGSQPPVSTIVKARPRQVASYVTRSRVTPGVSSTTAWRLPKILLTSVDLPTLGRPTTASTGAAASGRSASSSGSATRDRPAGTRHVGDEPDNLVGVETARVNLDRVIGHDHPGGIALIPACLLAFGRLDRRRRIRGQVCAAALCANIFCRRQVHLDRRVGCDHRADVAAFGDNPLARRRVRDDVSLHSDQQSAHLRDRGNDADRVRDVAATDGSGHIPTVHHDRRRSRVRADPYARLGDASKHGAGVIKVDSVLPQPPGERSVHGTGIQVAQAQLRRDPAGHCRLARPRGPVHGDHETGFAGITLHFVHAGRYHPGG